MKLREEQYLQAAEEAEADAKKAVDPKARVAFLEMAQRFRELAKRARLDTV